MSEPVKDASPPTRRGLPLTWLILVLFLAGGIGYIAWNGHTSSPGYRAKKRLDQADALAAEGKVGEAAKVYRELALAGGEQARPALERFRRMLDKSLDEAALGQAATAILIASEWPGQPELANGLARRALAMCRERGDEDPDGAVELLRVFVNLPGDPPHPQRIQEANELMTLWANRHKDNLEVQTAYGFRLRTIDDIAGVEKALAPLRDKLGTTDGAYLLAWSYFRQGKGPAALELLEPFCRERLPKFKEADEEYRQVRDKVVKELEARIDRGDAPSFDYEASKAANEEQRRQLRGQYVEVHQHENIELREAARVYERQRMVPDAVLTLAGLQREKGWAQADPEKRRALFESAEKALLSLRNTSGESPDIYLGLSEIAWWLGQPEKAQAYLDDLLERNHRAPGILLVVAEVLHARGDLAAARKLLDEAYEIIPDGNQRQGIVFQRVQLSIEIAEQQGRDAEAAEELRKVIDQLARVPDPLWRAHQEGLARLRLFRLTGEKKDLDAGIALLDRALKQQPASPVLVHDAMQNVYLAACCDLAIDHVDAAVLKPSANLGHLAYLFEDRAGRQDQAARLRKHAGIRKTRELADKLLTLQPGNPFACDVLLTLALWEHDATGLKELVTRMGAVAPIPGEQARLNPAWRPDERQKQAWQRDVALWEKRIEQMGRKKAAVSVAVAEVVLMRVLLRGEQLGEKVDAARVVALAESARTNCPSRATDDALVDALLHRAHQQLVEREPGYRQMAEKARRSLDASFLVALALTRDGPAREPAAKHPDVVRAGRMLKERSEAYPDEPSAWAMALLQGTHPEAARKVADALRTDEVSRLARSLTLKLRLSVPAALEEYWVLKLEGKDKDAEALLRKLADRGVALPF